MYILHTSAQRTNSYIAITINSVFIVHCGVQFEVNASRATITP